MTAEDKPQQMKQEVKTEPEDEVQSAFAGYATIKTYSYPGNACARARLQAMWSRTPLYAGGRRVPRERVPLRSTGRTKGTEGVPMVDGTPMSGFTGMHEFDAQGHVGMHEQLQLAYPLI